jgi:hypothetical protein
LKENIAKKINEYLDRCEELKEVLEEEHQQKHAQQESGKKQMDNATKPVKESEVRRDSGKQKEIEAQLEKLRLEKEKQERDETARRADRQKQKKIEEENKASEKKEKEAKLPVEKKKKEEHKKAHEQVNNLVAIPNSGRAPLNRTRTKRKYFMRTISVTQSKFQLQEKQTVSHSSTQYNITSVNSFKHIHK